jgi:hypothetical protein
LRRRPSVVDPNSARPTSSATLPDDDHIGVFAVGNVADDVGRRALRHLVEGAPFTSRRGALHERGQLRPRFGVDVDAGGARGTRQERILGMDDVQPRAGVFRQARGKGQGGA